MTSAQVVSTSRDAVLWALWAFACGWWHRRTPPSQLRVDGRLLQLRPFEAKGRWYERRLLIKRWKDRLPETGGLWGGMSKRQLPGTSERYLDQFSSECRRGERTHLSIIAGTPALGLWNSLDMTMLLTSLSVAVNAPFMAVLRYNRARIAGFGRPAGP